MKVAELQKICPAQIGSELATMLRDISVATFRACLRDYARVDFRVDRSGQPFVLEINCCPSLNSKNSYVRAATTRGYSFSNLVNRILDRAHMRYFGTGIPKAGHVSNRERILPRWPPVGQTLCCFQDSDDGEDGDTPRITKALADTDLDGEEGAMISVVSTPCRHSQRFSARSRKVYRNEIAHRMCHCGQL